MDECPFCGTAIKAFERECPECSELLIPTCPSCDTITQWSMSLCPECNGELPVDRYKEQFKRLESQRKLKEEIQRKAGKAQRKQQRQDQKAQKKQLARDKKQQKPQRAPGAQDSSDGQTLELILILVFLVLVAAAVGLVTYLGVSFLLGEFAALVMTA